MGTEIVEMAGIEPASERIDPRTSTSVASLWSRNWPDYLQNRKAAIRSGPKALFRNPRGVGGGSLTLWRPHLLPVRRRSRRTWPHAEVICWSPSLRQRGGEQRTECDWHL